MSEAPLTTTSPFNRGLKPSTSTSFFPSLSHLDLCAYLTTAMTDDSRKRKRQHPFDDMAAVCSPIRGPSQRPRYSLDDSFSVDIDLELSFASNMSLGSPPQSPLVNNFFTAGAPQSPMAMDISPAPQSRQKPQRSVGETAPVFSPMRKRSNTVRAFGRELSNGSSPKTSSSTSFKEQMFQHTTRSPLPGEWLKMEGHLQGVCFHF